MLYFMTFTKKGTLLSFLLVLLLGCSKLESVRIESIPEYGIEEFEGDYVTSNEVLERAYQMATLKWSPIRRVPFNDGLCFEPGRIVTGAPYSSVKEINTYLFQDVSYHTFMTAVHNPNSVLYTEDISMAPYHGLNCASYYGSVCSSSVMWVLGISIPYYADQIISLPNMKKLESQTIDSLKICDVIWKKGHVQMIYDLEYRAGALNKITTFESTYKSARLSSYSKEQFQKMWNTHGYVGYRYEKLIPSKEPISFRGFNPISYNDDLCPSKGDRAVYRTSDVITINIFNQKYDRIVLSRDGRIVSSDYLDGEDYSFCNLNPGIYMVCLENESQKTETVSFEVVDVHVRCSIDDDERRISILFSSSAEAEYVAICDQTGGSLYYPISDLGKKSGSISVPIEDESKDYCKVVFKGKYGRIINEPIKIRDN